MATPTFRSAGTIGQANNQITLTLNYTLTSGDLLLVTFNAGDAAVRSVSSVVWNGSETMTLIGNGDANAFRRNFVYGLMGATPGAHSVVITLDATAILIVGVVFGYSNVHTTTPWDASPETAFATSTSPSVTYDGGASGDLVVVTALSNEDYTSLTMTNGTKRNEQVSADEGVIIIDAPSSASDVTVNGSYGSSVTWVWASFNLNASVDAATLDWLPVTEVSQGPSMIAVPVGPIPPTVPQ